jgi:hypothetical protein
MQEKTIKRRFFMTCVTTLMLSTSIGCAQENKTPEQSTLTPAHSGPQTLRVYHIGNSVTDTINYAALQKMAES